MDAALKIVRLIRIALIASIVLYALIGEVVGRGVTTVPNTTVYFAITFVAIADVGAIAVMRRLFVTPAEGVLASQPADTAALGRWRAGYLITYALCEAVALFGLVLRILGFPLSQVATFYAVGLILLLLFGPRRPSNEIG